MQLCAAQNGHVLALMSPPLPPSFPQVFESLEAKKLTDRAKLLLRSLSEAGCKDLDEYYCTVHGPDANKKAQ